MRGGIRRLASCRWMLAAAGCAGCASSAVQQTGAPANVPEAVPLRLTPPKVRIVDPQLAAERSVKSEPVMVPFGTNQNGTELVYSLLEHAAEAGARYVADMRMFVTFRWRGAPVECRTAILLEGDPRLATSAARDPGAGTSGPYQTDVTAYRPQKVEFVADDRELVCHKVNVAENKWRRARDNERAAEGSRLTRIDPESREVVTEIVQRDDCEWKQITRQTTRYDYEVKLGLVPPNYAHLQARFARRALVAGTPTCYTLAEEALASQPAYRLTATAYHRGKVTQRLPDVSPSMEMINPSNYGPQKKLTKRDSGEECG